MNLAGIETEELARGDVLARPGTLARTSMLDVELRLLPESKPLRDGARAFGGCRSTARVGSTRSPERARP